MIYLIAIRYGAVKPNPNQLVYGEVSVLSLKVYTDLFVPFAIANVSGFISSSHKCLSVYIHTNLACLEISHKPKSALCGHTKIVAGFFGAVKRGSGFGGSGIFYKGIIVKIISHITTPSPGSRAMPIRSRKSSPPHVSGRHGHAAYGTGVNDSCTTKSKYN